MKKSILTFLLLFMGLQLYAQRQGLLLDQIDQQPIKGAYILSRDTVQTNDQGIFFYHPGYEILIQSMGYQDLRMMALDTPLVILLAPGPVLLDAITVNDFGIPQRNQIYPGAITQLSSKEISTSDPTLMTALFNQVPGVFMQSGALNTNKITMRGVGSRATFSTKKIRAYYQDIPLTNGSGETTIEDIDLNTIGTIEILKGPNASIYGSGLGGTLILHPKKTPLASQSLSTAATVGSFGLLRNSLTYALDQNQRSIHLLFNRQQSDGYRDNNTFKRNTLLATSSLNTIKNTFNFLMYYVNQYAGIPSSLSETDYQNEPTIAAFTWGQSQGFEDYDKFLLGSSWTHTYHPGLTQHVSLFGSFNQSFEARPFNILEDQIYGVGLRARLIKKIPKTQHQVMAGLETYQDAYHWKTAENLYADFPNTGSVQGEYLSDNEEIRRYYNVFLEVNLKPLASLNIDLGLNLNQTFYDYTDAYDLDSIDQSGNYQFQARYSPRIGISHTFRPGLTHFALMSHGFSPPSLEETLTPEGTINPDIKPETGWNFEWGMKGHSWGKKLTYSFSIYQMNIRDLLVSRRTAKDQYTGINAGSTRHRGIELSIKSRLIQTLNFTLNQSLNYNHAAYRFEEFEEEINGELLRYDGNALTGIPANQLSLSFQGNFKERLYAHLSYQHIDRIPLTDNNSRYSTAYQITSFQIGWQPTIFTKLDLDLSYRINNLFNEVYASMHQINARAFGSGSPRYYYPGLPRNHMITLKMKFGL